MEFDDAFVTSNGHRVQGKLKSMFHCRSSRTHISNRPVSGASAGLVMVPLRHFINDPQIKTLKPAGIYYLLYERGAKPLLEQCPQQAGSPGSPHATYLPGQHCNAVLRAPPIKYSLAPTPVLSHLSSHPFLKQGAKRYNTPQWSRTSK